VADEIPHLARTQRRWIRIACAFPDSATAANRRGINHTDWLPIDRATYDTCTDPHDYRTGVPPAPKRTTPTKAAPPPPPASP
jgi:hypothetical protein